MTVSQVQRARRLYRSGLTQVQVALRLGVHEGQVQWAVASAPDYRRQRHGSPRKLLLDKSQVLDARARGMTFREIGQPFGVTGQAARDRLRRG